MQKFEELIQRLANDKGLKGKAESATREVAVNPVLAHLGWEISDADEVFREFPVEGGQVDYCLKTRQKSHVLIEVKRTGEALVDHEQQLLRYSFAEGVPLAVLTDGLIWWLYIPSGEGNWKNRRFFDVNFHKDSKGEASKNLMRFLGKRAVLDGSAAKEAQKEFNKLQQEKQASGELPKAWQELVSDPEGLLINLLKEKVKELSEFEPSTEQIAGFLQKLSIPPIDNISKSILKPSKELKHKLSEEQNSETEIISAPSNVTGLNIKAFCIGDDCYAVTSWQEMLIQVCEIVIPQLGSNFFEAAKDLDSIKRAKNDYFINTENIAKPDTELRNKYHQLSNGIFVYIYLGSEKINEMVKEMIALIGKPIKAYKIEVTKK